MSDSAGSAFFAAVLDSIDSHVAVIDGDGVIVYVNQAWAEFSERSEASPGPGWVGRNYLESCSEAADGGANAAQVRAGLSAVLRRRQEEFRHEYPCHSADRQRWFMMRMVALQGDDRHFIVSHNDTTGRKLAEQRVEKANRELSERSVTDPLTQLCNRQHLDEAFSAEIARAQRYGGTFSACLLDADHFKSVNDRFGHQAGDAVLVELADALLAGVRESDTVGRWGGEKFLVLLPQTSAVAAAALADKLRSRIAAHDFSEPGRLTCSFGVTGFVSGDTPDRMLARANTALHDAKRGGRNCVVLLDARS